jgi:hypothetical protein
MDSRRAWVSSPRTGEDGPLELYDDGSTQHLE